VGGIGNDTEVLSVEAAAVMRTFNSKGSFPERATPLAFFDRLHARYRFTLDGAASAKNKKLARYSSAARPLPWAGERVFCNPPWSDIPPFVELAATARLAVLLVPARTNVRWFHRALELGARPEYFEGRLHFDEMPSGSAVDCVLLVFGR
jgi:hypothetical protein